MFFSHFQISRKPERKIMVIPRKLILYVSSKFLWVRLVDSSYFLKGGGEKNFFFNRYYLDLLYLIGPPVGHPKMLYHSSILTNCTTFFGAQRSGKRYFDVLLFAKLFKPSFYPYSIGVIPRLRDITLEFYSNLSVILIKMV